MSIERISITAVLLVAGLWVTFRPLHPVEKHVNRLGTWPKFQRVFALLTTLLVIVAVWSY